MKTVDSVLSNKNNFDTLRLLAAVGVVLSHAYPATQGSNKNEFLHVLSGGQATLGELCVAVFFIISGFLITQSFSRSKSLVEYLVNRILRIFPALLVITFLTCLVLGPLVTTRASSDYWFKWHTIRYMGNALIYPTAQKLPGVFETSIYPYVTNASIWTLSYEFTCYLCVAAIGLMIRKSWFLATMMGTIAAVTVFYTYISPPIFVKFAAYFFAGAIAYAGRKMVVLDLKVFIISILALCIFIFLHQGLIVAICIFGTYATIYLAYAHYLPAHKIMRHGDFSYGIYLYAWPVQQLLVPIAQTPFLNFLSSLPLIILLSVCSWKLVEKPALSRKQTVANFINSKIGGIRKSLVPIPIAPANSSAHKGR